MDEKSSSPDGLPVTIILPQQQQTRRHTLHARILRFAGAAAVVYLTLTVLGALGRPASYWEPPASVLDDALTRPSAKSRPVPLEAHIMSKCPDARDCLQLMILPVMQEVGDKVNFTMSYIGTPDDDSSSAHVTCMHGETECAGNVFELCAAREYPDPKLYLGFTMCLAKDYQHIPEDELVSECALEHGINRDTLDQCVIDHGANLLLASVKRSRAANVTYSCTIRLNGEKRCIRDGGKWKDCDGGSSVKSIVDDIEKLYAESQTEDDTVRNQLEADW